MNERREAISSARIIDNRKNNILEFGELPCGSFFERGNVIFIKAVETNGHSFAVGLSSGRKHDFNDLDEVGILNNVQIVLN